jgi:hypothetical protein
MSTPERNAALRALYAAAGEIGVTDAELHRWASRNFAMESLTTVDVVMLRGLAVSLADPDFVKEFRWRNRVIPTANEPMFSPDQWAALQSDADSVAERFRR